MMKPLFDDMNYADCCFFFLRKKAGSLLGTHYNPRSDNFNLEKMRLELWEQFKIPKDRRIFYVDEDNDIIPIDSECEFHEVLKLAKNTVMNKPIQLIVGSYVNNLHVPSSEDDEYIIKFCPLKTENDSSSVEQKRDTVNNSSRPKSTCKLEQRHVYGKPLLMKKWDRKRHNKSDEEQKESKDMKTLKKLDASLRFGLHSDTPPSWFTEYMESMKKDMISTISHEVTKSVTESLKKYFDFSASFPPKKGHLHQLYPFLRRRHSEYYCTSNDKKQKRMMHQDEEQSSDASIERVDEPQDVNIPEDPQMKKDVRSTIRHETVKEMTEVSNKTSRNRPVLVPFKKFTHHENQSHLPFTKRFSRFSFDSHLNEKSQGKMRFQDAEQLSDDASIEHMDETRSMNTTENPRPLQEKIDLLQDAICDYAKDIVKEKKKKKRHYQQIVQMDSKNMENDICKEQQLSSKNNEFVPRKDLPLQVDQKPYDERLRLETLKMLENELRMSCSVTGHQMLDEDLRNKNIWSCNYLHLDSSAYDSSEVDDDAFEIVQMPISRNANESRPEKSNTEQQQYDSSRDSPSFELLSELPSPTSTCMNEDLLTNKETEERPEPEERSESTEKPESEEMIEQQLENPNLSRLAYIIDANGKIRGHYDKKEFSHHTIKNDNAPIWDIECLVSSHDDMNSSYSDVRNSHPSYMPVSQCKMPQSQHTCQSQTNLIDFTQSFHSHTTSVTTDTTDTIDTIEIYADACDNERYGERIPTVTGPENVQEMTATATTETSAQETRTAKSVQETEPMATASSGNDFVGGDWEKEAKTNEKYHYDANGDSRMYPFPAPRRANKSSNKPISNGDLQRKYTSEESLGAAEPVHTLPEVLVSAAAQFGSLAYITARSAIAVHEHLFDKIRAHARKDAAKRKDKMRQ